MRVHWADETVGAITDIAYFVPGDEEEPVEPASSDKDPVTMIVTPVSLTIQHTASHEESAYLRAIAQGKLIGARTGESGKVYFPPHAPTRPPACPPPNSSNCPTKAR